MAKGKKSKGNNYVSKGERPSVNKNALKLAARARSALKPVDDIEHSMAQRNRVTNKPQNEKERKLKQRYEGENEVFTTAAFLFNKYRAVGLKWAGAVQAIKTNKIDLVENKYFKLREEYLAKLKSQGNLAMAR